MVLRFNLSLQRSGLPAFISTKWFADHLPDVSNLMHTYHFRDVAKMVFSATNQLQNHTNQPSINQGEHAGSNKHA
jgi:hypothetical protein